MHTQPLLLTLASAAIASADILPAHRNFGRALEARQTAGLPSCVEPLLSLYGTMPTPPPELADLPPPADPCNVTPPPAVAPIYSSYSSELVSWIGEHSAEVFSALSACPEIAGQAGDHIQSITEGLCESVTTSVEDHASHTESSVEETGSVEPSVSSGGGSNATFTSGGGPSSTGGGGSGPAQTTSQSTALAARETGFVGAAIAAVGFLGAIAAL